MTSSRCSECQGLDCLLQASQQPWAGLITVTRDKVRLRVMEIQTPGHRLLGGGQVGLTTNHTGDKGLKEGRMESEQQP